MTHCEKMVLNRRNVACVKSCLFHVLYGVKKQTHTHIHTHTPHHSHYLLQSNSYYNPNSLFSSLCHPKPLILYLNTQGKAFSGQALLLPKTEGHEHQVYFKILTNLFVRHVFEAQIFCVFLFLFVWPRDVQQKCVLVYRLTEQE